MSYRLRAAVHHLAQAKEQLGSGQITSAQHAALREAALMRALEELASQCGVELVMPLQIDSIGEVNIVVNSEAATHGSGCFGQAFVDHLLRPAQNATNELTLLQVEQSDVSHRAMESAQAARSVGHGWGAPVDIGTHSNAASCDAGGVGVVSGRVFTAANPPNPEDRCSSPH
jgi:hypothetical protein